MNENCTLQLHNYGTTIVDGFVQFKYIAFMITLLKATYIFISALKINILLACCQPDLGGYATFCVGQKIIALL